jgi:hypothetical protein
MKKTKEEFVNYQGRSVPKKHFRVFVYNQNGGRLVNSYEDFKAHIDSKEWFETKAEIPPIKLPKVKKHDSNRKRVCE